jgi:hypothetical protein
MRLVTFAIAGAERLGALIAGDRRIVDFAAATAGETPPR